MLYFWLSSDLFFINILKQHLHTIFSKSLDEASLQVSFLPRVAALHCSLQGVTQRIEFIVFFKMIPGKEQENQIKQN